MTGPVRDAAYAELPTKSRRRTMTLCPIAMVAGCRICPALSVCPLKTVIGDMPKQEAPKTPEKK